MEQEKGKANSPANEPESWQEKMVLTFDGGGIRGYASLLLLEKLMMEIGKIERSTEYLDIHDEPHPTSFMPFPKPNNLETRRTDKHRYREGAHVEDYFPCHYFDLIAGTSTGGLIATMLSRLRMSVADCLNKYEEVGKVTFSNPRLHILGYPREKYSKGTFITAIKNLTCQRSSTPHKPEEDLSDEYRLFPSPEDLCRTFVVAIQRGKSTSSPSGETPKSSVQDGPYLFRSYIPAMRPIDRDEEGYIVARNYGVGIKHEIWKACRATTAAPTYFESLKIGDEEYCDGGVGINNPTWEALNEMDLLYKNGPKVIASFGTGKPAPSSVFKGNKSHKLHITQAIKDAHSMFKTGKGALTDCENTHEDMRKIKRERRRGENSFSYYRLNISEGLGKVKLDEWKQQRDDGEGTGGKCTTLEYLEKCVEKEWAKKEVQEETRELARILVRQRRRRLRDDRDRYERFATCVAYNCPIDLCKERNQKFNLERELRDHLLTQHPQESAQDQWLTNVLKSSRVAPRVSSGPC